MAVENRSSDHQTVRLLAIDVASATWRRAMEFFSGLDAGMDETAICMVDDKGKVALQATV
jgi:hypothetical protein